MYEPVPTAPVVVLTLERVVTLGGCVTVDEDGESMAVAVFSALDKREEETAAVLELPCSEEGEEADVNELGIEVVSSGTSIDAHVDSGHSSANDHKQSNSQQRIDTHLTEAQSERRRTCVPRP